MAMHPQEWSIHALSVEFGINPNVVSRRLRDVQPCRSEGKPPLVADVRSGASAQ